MHTKEQKKRRVPARLFFLILIITLFFYDIIFFGKTLSTSQFVPGTTRQGPYISLDSRGSVLSKEKNSGLSPFSFDLTGNAWINEANPYIIKKNVSLSALPAWSNDEGLGMPIIANPNTEAFNPLKSFLNLYPTPFAQDMFFLLRLLIMGIFTYLFLKQLGLSAVPSLFGGAFFMLSGYSIWWINLHPLSSMTYIPGLFYFYQKAISEENICKGISAGKSRFRMFLSYFFFSLFLAFSIFSGKVPVVIMGLMLLFVYALYGNLVSAIDRGHGAMQTLKGLLPAKLIILTITGMITASALILPFTELLARSSLIAGNIRTGASSITLPLIPSITLWQPLFFGLKDYFYNSWLKWSPNYMMPYAGVTVLMLCLYAVLSRRVLVKALPFLLFSLFLFLKIYGLIPNDLFTGVPVLGSMNFIKYHGMFYFSLAIISAYSLEDIRISKSNVFYFAVILTALILFAYFYALSSLCPPEKINYITKVLLTTLALLSVTGIFFYMTETSGLLSKKSLVLMLFILMLAELYIYMPKKHPERVFPYNPPPYSDMITESHPYRITGDGTSVPPLVSSAVGFHDLRGINVLIPDDYYRIFENLISFSAPYTNNPSPLLSATSPFSDLLGVKYILSRDKLDIGQLKQALRYHLGGLRTVRFFDSVKAHRIKGGSEFGYFNRAGENRFSILFTRNFRFASKVRITEPYLFIGLTLKRDKNINAQPSHQGNDLQITVKAVINGNVHDFIVSPDKWTEKWIDISKFIGETIDIIIESASSGQGRVVLGNFGLSKGRRQEQMLLNTLYDRHLREFSLIKYIGQYEGIHIYENNNVMPRAFIVHETKIAGSVEEVISELQSGLDFRKIALISGKDLLYGIQQDANTKDRVTITEYSSDRTEINVNTKGGLLVLSDLYYPGWKVKVNGEGGEIIRTFGGLRGVEVPGGKSRVVFYYRPMSLYTGIVISFISLAVWILFLLLTLRKSKGNVETYI